MILSHLIKEECPKCHKGKVFKTSLLNFKVGRMNKECPECHLNFTKEPGFYFGAMYLSYILAVVEIIITYFICRILGTGTFDLINLWVMIGAIIVLSPMNFKLSRLIWLYLFPEDQY